MSSENQPSAIRCMWMRGGSSKGGYFVKSDLPDDAARRDVLLLEIMGSPDARQIDGLGGGDTLTSKVAVVSPSERSGIDVEYLFLQVWVDEANVSDAQNCGNILAGVGPFAIERGLVAAGDGQTTVRIFMVNTGQVAIATVQTPGGTVTYTGDTRMDGVPGSAAPVKVTFSSIAGSSCGALLPSGSPRDTIDGIEVTMIDNGMPSVVLKAADMGISGEELPKELDANLALIERLERIRLSAGPLMNLGDVTRLSVPKLTMISPPRHGGIVSTRTFIPHKCHASIGVFGAVTVATACVTEGSVAAGVATPPAGDGDLVLNVEHPLGYTSIVANASTGETAVLLTARKLFDGVVFARS